MSTLIELCEFNASYADAIDSDQLERWPAFFTNDCHYRITNVENESEGLMAGLVYADSRAMLVDRIAALREANIYERQRYRHIIGLPMIGTAQDDSVEAKTPFMVTRSVSAGPSELFATGVYQDRFVRIENRWALARRVVVCDSSTIDTLLALPL
ncbi:MAG: nuclear transport factor 2 family protein [Burkholderiales bacterium]|nr:nuclear transport factor 2 family protein [Burkholderiales bacterium]